MVADNEGFAARIKRTFQLAAAVQNITHRTSFVYILNGAAAENQLLQLASEHQLDGQLFIGRQKLLPKGAKIPTLLLNFISGLYIFRILLERMRLHDDSFIFLYGQSFFLHFPSFLLAKLSKKNICCDLTEEIARRRFDIINPSYLDFQLFTHILCNIMTALVYLNIGGLIGSS